MEVKGRREVEVGGDEVHRVKGVAMHIVSGSRTTVIGAAGSSPSSVSARNMSFCNSYSASTTACQ